MCQFSTCTEWKNTIILLWKLGNSGSRGNQINNKHNATPTLLIDNWKQGCIATTRHCCLWWVSHGVVLFSKFWLGAFAECFFGGWRRCNKAPGAKMEKPVMVWTTEEVPMSLGCSSLIGGLTYIFPRGWIWWKRGHGRKVWRMKKGGQTEEQKENKGVGVDEEKK